jgi:hydroxymethylbilane synthase
MKTLTLGTRGSDLALWQTRHVMKLLQQAHPTLSCREQLIVTRGDVDQSARLVGKLEKGFFTLELEEHLRAQKIDLAVHSLKDLPTRFAPGLALGAVLERANACDWLLVRHEWVDEKNLFPVKAQARVGASSLRRESMVKHHAPHAVSVPLRGNVPTRVQRLREGACEAILLAAAGLSRLQLDLSDLAVFELDAQVWVPAPGQGAVAAEIRAGDETTQRWLSPLHHSSTALTTEWERSFLRVLEGGCATPFGCSVDQGRAHLGQLIDGSWKVHSVDLPSALPDTQISFIESSLQERNFVHAPIVPFVRKL